jgi:hypothetical protein
MELNEFVRSLFNIGLYGIALVSLFYVVRYGIGIIKSWTTYVNYKAVGQKLKIKRELINIGIKEEEIDLEVSKLSGIIYRHLKDNGEKIDNEKEKRNEEHQTANKDYTKN